MLIEELLVLVPNPYLYPIKFSVGEGMLIEVLFVLVLLLYPISLMLNEGLFVLVLLPYPIPTCILSNSH